MHRQCNLQGQGTVRYASDTCAMRHTHMVLRQLRPLLLELLLLVQGIAAVAGPVGEEDLGNADIAVDLAELRVGAVARGAAI